MSGMFGASFDDAQPLPAQPIPIRPAVPEPGEYPVDALSPKLKAATLAIVDKVQLPPSIAANSVLAVAALAVQPFIDVQLPTGEIIPTSLFICTVAASGDRKSSADKLALRSVRARERDMHDDWLGINGAFVADNAAYQAARKKALTGNKSRVQIKTDLEACGPEPVAPPLPMLVSDEGTLQGLQKAFAEAMPSLGLFNDEGGAWLGGYAMSEDNRGQTGATLSKMWDGAPIKRVRGTEAVTILRGRRLSLHLMIQHRIAARLFGDEDLKDQGLLSRILIAQPMTMKGTRAWHEPDPISDIDLQAYQARVYRLLSEPMPMHPETRELKPRVVVLSDDARALWTSWHDAVETDLAPDGAYGNVAGFAAKLPEHATRIAAVLAYFEDRNVEQVSVAALAAGIKLAQFYANEALRVIGLGNADQDNDNASALIAWIRKRGEPVVGHRWLSLNAAPTSLRPASVLRRAVDILMENGHLVEIKGGASMTIAGKPKLFRQAYTVIEDPSE